MIEMEAVQCTENNSKVITIETPSNRLLKRNISELAKDGKLNEDFKSPVRKEVKVAHETYLLRELEQWKDLLKEQNIRNSIMPSELFDSNTLESDDLVMPDLKNYIAEGIDIPKMLNESRKFRQKMEFFLYLNKLEQNIQTDLTNDALDKSKQQALKFRMDFMHCEQFNSLENLP